MDNKSIAMGATAMIIADQGKRIKELESYKEETVFRLTFEDFESVLGRELTQDEKALISDKFNIDDWNEIIKNFIECYEVTL